MNSHPLCSQGKIKRVRSQFAAEMSLQQGMKTRTVVPTAVALTSPSLKHAAVTIKPGSILLFCFKDGLPAPAHLWQEIPLQFSGFFLPEFMILISVVDTFLVYHQWPDGVTTSLHVCRGSQGSPRSPSVFGNLVSLRVPAAISYLFFESLHRHTYRNTQQIEIFNICIFLKIAKDIYGTVKPTRSKTAVRRLTLCSRGSALGTRKDIFEQVLIFSPC